MRRAISLMMLGVLSIAAAPASAPTTTDLDGVMVLGNLRAPITVSEFASVGCPHCAHWALTVYPALRAKYIDTGRVRFEFHEMLTGDPALAAAGFLVARCAGTPMYFQVVDQVFAHQAEIEQQGAPALLAIAKAAGLPEDRSKACLSNEAALRALGERTEADAKLHHVQGTPTFFVNGVKVEGNGSLSEFDTAIARARGR